MNKVLNSHKASAYFSNISPKQKKFNELNGDLKNGCFPMSQNLKDSGIKKNCKCSNSYEQIPC